MSDNGNGTVKTAVSFAEAHGDDSHLQIIITQATYDAVMEVMDMDRNRARTSGRGFEEWLEELTDRASKLQVSQWTKNDLGLLTKQALQGNRKAIAELRKQCPALFEAEATLPNR
jgi:hypothetical protein